MNTTCPICGKPVDPLRARHVAVREGKVVAYDTAECQQSAETKPTAVPTGMPARVRTPVAGVPSKLPTLESGPIIEIVRDPASGPVKEPSKLADKKDKKRDDTTLQKWTRETDDQEAETNAMHAAGDSLSAGDLAPRKKSIAPLILIAVVLLGAAAFVGYRILVGSSTKPAPPTAPVEKSELPQPKPPEAPPKPDPHKVLEEAEAVLRGIMATQPPRVQRFAAIALARTKDPAAIELLGSQLTDEKTDAGKLELGYALARASDARGRKVLVDMLGSPRRDAKQESGRRLALLGDTAGANVVASYLAVEQNRLGAAEILAFLKDERGLKVLDAVRTAPKSTADEKARATIALGIAGRTDVVPDLQALLKDDHFKSQAAGALATLGDPTARAVLAEQLAVVQLRADAARSLRILEPTLDPTPFLPELVAGIQSKKDTEQVPSAEAILLLAGDREWSDHQ
ncbi:hypothetical protein BH11MYX2_BH11MYX2_35040 [soil metagenome]